MHPRVAPRPQRPAALLTGLFLLAMAPGLTAADRPAPTLPEEQLVQRLDQWFATHPTGRVYLQLDKPLYQPGETIWFKVSLFETKTLAHFAGAAGYQCQLVDPRGAVVVRKDVPMQNGTGENDIVIPAGVAGGEFTLKVQFPGGPEDERPVIVNAYQAPLLKKKLDVLGKGYGPGDRVEAKAEFRRGTGEVLAGKPIVGIVIVDGREYKRLDLKTDAAGALLVAFELPAKLETEDALLTLKVEEGGITESISRSIPLLLAKLNVDFFPEGGDLVAGLPSRVYFQALKPNGKPAEVEGIVVDQQGTEVARLKSWHQGLGRFEFTPAAGSRYELRVLRPAGIARRYALPEARPDGVVLRVADDFTGQRADLRLTIHSRSARPGTLIVAAVREQVAAVRTVDLQPGATDVSIFPEAGQGVLRLTVLDQDATPLCERVVYRQLGRDLRVELKADKDHYLPREKVTLTVRTTLPNGRPVPAELCLGVSDDRVLSYADDKTAHLLTHLYLEKDLPGKIEEPNFYLDPKEAKAALALELLMGTRGWRRFEWQRLADPAKFNDVRVTDQLLRQVAEQYARAGRAKALGAAAAVDMELADEALAVADGGKKGVKADAKVQFAPPAPRPAAAAPAAKPARPPAAATPPAKPAPLPALVAPPPPAMEKAKEIAARKDLDAPQRVAGRQMAPEIDIANDKLLQEREFAGPVWAVVRQFPAVTYATPVAEVRNDFRETIAWQPRVVTDPAGRATVEFCLSDAVTSFRVRAEGNATSGLPGRGELVLDARTPLHLEAKLPVALSAGDVLELPLRVTNETARSLKVQGGLRLPPGLVAAFAGEPLAAFDLAPNSARTFYLPVKAQSGRFTDGLGFWAKADGLTDTVNRPLLIEPVGFPFQESVSDTLKDTRTSRIVLPPGLVPGSLTATVKFYPSPLASMLEGLESILREPCGCFEQTSSSTYPNIMVLNYLKGREANLPEVEKRARDLIEKGYRRLVGFESKRQGYEWFGGDPGHEALTAYGLMEFLDLAKVYDQVDREMLQRTTTWMLAQRDGQGGFKRNPQALDSFGRATPEVTNAYIVWALSEAGIKGLDAELAHVAKVAYTAKNPYLIGLAALALAAQNPNAPDVKELVGLLAAAKQTDGSYAGVGSSITGSTGQSLNVETTALAVLAQLRAGKPAAALNDSVQWLMRQRQGGGFGPPQSTILALKALTEFALASRAVTDDGDIVVRVNGNAVARKHFSRGDQGTIEIGGLATALREGPNDIDLQLDSKTALPFSLDVNYQTATPTANRDCAVRLTAALATPKVALGETVALTAELTNTTDKGQAMTLVRLGIPAGLTPELWQLKELREKGVFDFAETTAREVVLYYRQLAPKDVRKVTLNLRADLPGTYTGVASSAYLYYSPQQKWWTAPLQTQVTR